MQAESKWKHTTIKDLIYWIFISLNCLFCQSTNVQLPSYKTAMFSLKSKGTYRTYNTPWEINTLNKWAVPKWSNFGRFENSSENKCQHHILCKIHASHVHACRYFLRDWFFCSRIVCLKTSPSSQCISSGCSWLLELWLNSQSVI